MIISMDTQPHVELSSNHNDLEPAAESSSVASPVSPDLHTHCENCINVSTCKDSSCPIVPCDCGHKLHQCKIQDHALLCREANFKVREALFCRVSQKRTLNGSAAGRSVLWKSAVITSNNSMSSSPSHLGTGCASQDYLPTSTPPTSPLDLSSPSHTNTKSTCAGKRFLLDDAEMDVLERLAKDNPDLLTHGVNLDMEETITCSPEDETPPGFQDSDLMSPSSEHIGQLASSERGSIPSVEIICSDADEAQRRTDSLIELGENIVAEAVQLAKSTVEDMLQLQREQGEDKAKEQKQTSELLDSLMNQTPTPATRFSLAVDEADSPSDEPDNNEPDSEQLLDDASLSQHGPDEPETISDESSSCLEPVRIQAAKSPTLEDIPDLPDDSEKNKNRIINEVENDNDDDGDESQNSDTESHSPSPVDRYHCTGTVVRKVKKSETTACVQQTKMTTEKPAVPPKACTNPAEIPLSPDENFNSHINDCNISLAKLKDSYVTIAENGLGRDGAFKETAITGVNLSTLKQSYVQNANNNNNSYNINGPTSLPPERMLRSRENIPSINIERLRNAYNSLGHSECVKTQSPDDLVPVNINALRENFARQQSIHAVREPSPIEEVKLSVDKKKVQSQFSVDDGDSESKCKRCSKTVYPAERIRAEKAQYHKTCFRCKECNKTLSAESYNSHEGELYCANHFKQLFQPKANFDTDSGPQEQDLLSGCDLDHDGKQRKHEMIIRENEPMQLSPDVVRCDTRSNMEDLEGLSVNLGSIKSRFENQAKDEEVKKATSVADRSALSRSASVLKRLEKYQSVVAGEAKADSSDEEGEDVMDKVDISKHIEVCREMNELKNKWESGQVNKDGKELGKDELASLRKRICLGRSESMKVVYEKAVQEANTLDGKKSSAPDDLGVGHSFATNLKKKFETGEVLKEQEAERQEYSKSEKEDDLSVCQDTGIAQQAKNMFQQMDKELTSKPQNSSPAPLSKTSSESRWNRPVNNEPKKEIEIVKASDPGQKDHIEVETTKLTERFKFFQNFKEEPTSRKEFKMTPPREVGKENSPTPVCERDPNVVVGSTVIDDIPKVDTATKMREKFQGLIESPAEKIPSQVDASRQKPLKRITPPKEIFEGNVVENTPVVDPNVVKCSYKVDDDIQVEADKTKSMKARFENWSDLEDRKNLTNLEDDCLPVDNITRNMRAMFESNSNKSPQPQPNGQSAERHKTKVNRFVLGTPATEVCAMCQGKVFPMERREASGLVMHTKCFKCTHCNINLRLDGYSQNGGKLYCEAHYQQLFKVKGNYDEGFGREKWSRTPSPSSTETPSLNLPPNTSNPTLIA